MRQKAIDFRELLERLLPLDELPVNDRLAVQRALRSGVGGQLEAAALHALRQLEQSGAVRRLPTEQNGLGPIVRYEARDRLDVFTLHLPGPSRQGAWLVFPRASLPPQAQTGIDQVRRLLQLDDPTRLGDPRSLGDRDGLAESLRQIGRELLGASEVRLVAASAAAAGPPPVHAAVADAALRQPGHVWYCPDAGRCADLAPEVARRGLRSIVVAGVAAADGRGLGHLEILAEATDAFRPDDLALAALLADTCGGVLERVERLERLMFVDALTGAYNRSYFDLQVQNEMARAQREQASFALCIADIDSFKDFNTRYGYQAGNEVLVQVAHALRRGVRPFDTVSRWGGEEFPVLLTAPVTPAAVAAVCERLRSLVERQMVTLEGLDRQVHRVGVTVSIGVALFPEHGGTADDLWRAANQALLEAKHGPKNRVVFHRA